jgi:hypothetical protein
VHIISVGANLVDAMLNRSRSFGSASGPVRDHRPADLLRSRVGDDPQAADTLLRRWFDSSGRVPDELVRLVQTVQAGRWPAEVSAELMTFDRAAGSRVLPSEDLAVLLATDTVDGLTAALWNAVALVDGDLGRVRYLSEPRAGLHGPRGALVVRVPGLVARHESHLRTAMESLGVLGRQLLAEARDTEPFEFYLSGGFKAAIPYLIGLAEGLRSIRDNIDRVTASVLHEETDGRVIALPLRRLPIESVQEELKGFDAAGVHPRRPATSFLEGYAYDRADNNSPWKLTAFGRGLRELFGIPPADLGGR